MNPQSVQGTPSFSLPPAVTIHSSTQSSSTATRSNSEEKLASSLDSCPTKQVPPLHLCGSIETETTKPSSLGALRCTQISRMPLRMTIDNHTYPSFLRWWAYMLPAQHSLKTRTAVRCRRVLSCSEESHCRTGWGGRHPTAAGGVPQWCVCRLLRCLSA